jgi:hypothetical protein
VLIAQSGSKDFAIRFVDYANFGGDHKELANQIFAIYALIQQSTPT